MTFSPKAAFKYLTHLQGNPWIRREAMRAVDPTYPLFPVASFLATALILILLITRSIRQSWNLGVALLCFCLLLQNVTNGVNAIIWSDNVEAELQVYCDIGTSDSFCVHDSTA